MLDLLTQTPDAPGPCPWVQIVYGGVITVGGLVMLLVRAIRGKAYTGSLGKIAIAVILLGAAISFGLLAKLLAPLLGLLEKFAV